MNRSIRKGTGNGIGSHIRPFSPNLTFKTDQVENGVLQPYQEKAEAQYLRFELQQEKQRCQQIEMQLQAEINQRVQNEQLYFADVAQLRDENENLKLRCSELEIKVRENSILNQDTVRDATSKIALLSIEVERLNQISQRRLMENEQLQKQLDQKSLANELQAIQNLVEDLRNELLLKQKTIQYLQDQQNNQNNKQNNVDELVNQIETLSKIIEDKDYQLGDNKNIKNQLDSCYREIERLNKVIVQRNQELQDSYTQDWKRNFQEINEKYHRVQEQLCLVQAELEASKAIQRFK